MSEQVTIYPSDDSFTDVDNAGTNYGSETYLRIAGQSSAKKKITFFKFPTDEIPVGSTIVSAILYLYCWGGSAWHSADPVYRCIADWAEGTIKWENQPDISGDSLGIMDFSTTGWKTLDITTLFANWFSEAENNYGIQISNATSSSVLRQASLYPKERAGTDEDPYILVTYEPSIVKTFSESGSGAEALITDKILTIIDSGLGTDFWVLPEIILINFSDSGEGIENLLVNKILLLEDSGSGVESWVANKLREFADSGVGVDVFLRDWTPLFTDSGSGIEAYYHIYHYPPNLKRIIILIRDKK